MKTIYFVLLALSVYAACPNLCSGHGTCSQEGTCTCNRQPGLGLNKGAFTEFAWTGYDCSERTCPKGMTFSYDDEVYQFNTAIESNNGALNTNVNRTSTLRLLFESDNGRQAAAEREAAESDTTPTQDDGPDPTTLKPTTAGPSTVTPTTATVTTPATTTTAAPTPVNTTSPPIITEAPVVATEAPKVIISQEVKNTNIKETLPILQELPPAVEYIIVRCYLGKDLDVLLGEITINKLDQTNTGVLLDKFGIDDANAIITCSIPFTSTPVTKPSSVDITDSPVTTVQVTKGSGVVVTEQVYRTPLINTASNNQGQQGGSGGSTAPTAGIDQNDVLSKLQDVYGTLNLTGFAGGRMLADENCFGVDPKNPLPYEYLCVESENPKDGAAFYRMQKIQGQVICENNQLQLQVSVSDMDNIDGLCYFFGNVDTQLPYSEIYPWIGKSDGYYYFARYNPKTATIVAGFDADENSENLEGDTTVMLDLDKVPTMRKDDNNDGYKYDNRPVGDIQVAATPGAPMSIQLYNRKTGKFTKPIISTVETSEILNTPGGGLKLKITVSPTKPIANNGTINFGDEEGTSEDATGTSRMLWEDSQGRILAGEDAGDVALVNIIKSGAHTYMECSGRGNCNRQTGQCECYDGFEGDACQRTSCPNNCNNNGRCVVMDKNDKDDSTFESKFYGCECDAGFRGPDCSMLECPSAEDPNGATNLDGSDNEYRDCSGRGICDYTTGLCKCFSGYYGTACETQAMLQ